ncbi:RHS repeat-associated core domain-containing protein, partial [Streptomyces sp. NPDC001835]|uniref:RHS repeat-associated core domain-containing protein n=1 Tax=unclassified Streptomyces TaxID=2593676 RepID=UPI0033321035
RLYNPTTGRFLSTDPEYGGNANAYEYVTADPLNQYDLDGRSRWGFLSKGWKYAKRGWAAGKRGWRKVKYVARHSRVQCWRYPNAGGFGCKYLWKNHQKFRIDIHKLNGRRGYWPHYHRRPGIGRHRPWDPAPHGQPWWKRF